MFETKEYVILESPIVQQPIIESVQTEKATMKAILQTLEVPGANRRKYPRELVESQLREKSDRMKQGSFLGELDHPVTDDPVRNGVVLLQNVSHRIKEAWIENNRVYGILDTLTTPSGKILYNLTAIDKVPVGFSLRALGSVKQEGHVFNVVRMTMITYDAVSNPSFKEATIQELKLQDIKRAIESELSSETNQALLESSSINDTLICIGDKCYVLEHIDRLIDEYVAKVIYECLWGF